MYETRSSATSSVTVVQVRFADASLGATCLAFFVAVRALVKARFRG